MRHKALYAVAFITTAALLTIAGSASGANRAAKAAVTSAPAGCWADIPTPPVGSLSKFRGVAAVLANDVWAVGENRIAGLFQTLIEHWDGTAWSVVPSPNPSTGNNHLNGVVAVSANDIWAIGYYDVGFTSYATLTLHWDGIAWSVVTSPNPPSPGVYPVLNGVAAVSANDVWAVGHYFDGASSDRTLSMHWDGTAWSIVSSPNPGLYNNYLKSVAAASASDVWAVGYSQDTGGIYRTLALRWDGSSWAAVATPDPGPWENYLNAVTALSTGDLWAAGRYRDTSNVEQTVVLHGDGVAWSLVASPSPGASSNSLNGVAAVSSNDAWAVGSFGAFSSQVLYEHWDGAAWSVVPAANTQNGLADAVAAVSTNDVWAVGWYVTVDSTRTMAQRYRECTPTPTPSPTLTLTPSATLTAPTNTAVVPTNTPTYTPTHTLAVPTDTRTWTPTRTATWTATNTPTDLPTSTPACGLAWRVVSSPNAPADEDGLYAVTSVSANDAWAVGYSSNGPNLAQTLIEHWNGSSWSMASSPSPGQDSKLHGVAAVSANDVWAVGENDHQTLIEHWNGTQWNVVPSPSPSIHENNLFGVTVVSANDVWAVGMYFNGGTGQHESLTVRWNGTAWNVVPSPNVGVLMSIDGQAANDVWAVGGGILHWDGSAWSVSSGTAGTLFGVSAVASNDVWAVGIVQRIGLGPITLTEHWNGAAWSVVSSPSPGSQENYLLGVTAISSNEVWAVGWWSNGAALQTLIEEWDGVNWSVVPSPNANPAYLSFLQAVDAVPGTANDLWAVGYYLSGISQTLVENYSARCPTATATPTNTPSITPTVTRISTATITSTPTNTPTSTSACGLAWRVVSGPNFGPGQASILNGVSALSASNVWAVGEHQDTGFHSDTLVEHWDGTAWSIVPSPSPGSGFNPLNGVAAISANDVWAVGYSGNQPLVEHWDGTQWSVVSIPSIGAARLFGVTALSANDIWAVGYVENGDPQTLILHWNGTQWSAVPSPNAGSDGDFLNAVTAVSSNDVWAVGNSCSPSCYYHTTLVEHWDGTQWSVVSSPSNSGLDQLRSVTAISSNDVWAVGDDVGSGQMLILHWNGTQWSQVPAPSVGGTEHVLSGVTGLSANDVWTIGSYRPTNATIATLALHWNGTQWSQVPGPNPGQDSHAPSAVSAVSSGDIWAVGAQVNSNEIRTLTMHYSDPCATPSPTSTSSPTRTPTRTSTATTTTTTTSISTSAPSNTRTSTPTASATNTATGPTSTPTTPATLMPTSTPGCGFAWSVVSSPNPAGGSVSRLLAVAAVETNDAWAVGYHNNNGTDTTLIEHWNGTTWSIVSSPNNGSRLNAVAAVSANDIWAVGFYAANATSNSTLVEHWNGTAWTIVPSPNPIRAPHLNSFSSNLLGVAAIEANDVWAVGFYITSPSTTETLVEHWNGTAWSIVPSLNSGARNYLNGVTAVGANDIWAVGYQGSTHTTQTLVEHWNGTAWSIVPSPNTNTNTNILNAVAAEGTNDIWAVGYSESNSATQTLVEHWNGTSWSIVLSPNVGTSRSYLRSVSVLGPNNVWVAGYYQQSDPSSAGSLLGYWNGTSWDMYSHNVGPYGNSLNGVAAVSSNDVWAVGYVNTTSSTTETLVEHFGPAACPSRTVTPTNTLTRTRTSTQTPTAAATSTPTSTAGCGLAWRVVSSPNVTGSFNFLNAVAVVSANDVWAVGYVGSELSTLTMHWNGTQWSIFPSPNPGSQNNSLNGVVAISPNDVWAVGYSYNGSSISTLVEHWNGTQWSVVPSPNVGNFNILFGVAAVAANDVWAVGTGGLAQTLTLHWNGVAWNVVSSPNPPGDSRLQAVAVVAANDVWAVGYNTAGNPVAWLTLVEHWNGSQWSIVPSPNVVGAARDMLNAVKAVSGNDVWAVGTFQSASGPEYTLIEHWNGTAWSIVSSPNPEPSNVLQGVAAVSTNDVWAVGYSYGGQAPIPALVLHWDGTNWSPVSSPNPGNSYYALSSIAAVSANDVWAVGWQIVCCGNYDWQTLTMHYSDVCITPSVTPTNTPTRTPTHTPTRTSTSRPTATPTPCSVCSLRVSDVTVACNPDGTVHWTANIFNSGSCAVTNAQWGAALETRIGGGNFHPVKTQNGVITFPPGNTVVSGDFCYPFQPNTTGIRVTYVVIDPNGRCFPGGTSPVRSPCDLITTCPP